MHICPQEIAILLATVPALRYLVAWLIRQRAGLTFGEQLDLLLIIARVRV
jgi:hypothetical protein